MIQRPMGFQRLRYSVLLGPLILLLPSCIWVNWELVAGPDAETHLPTASDTPASVYFSLPQHFRPSLNSDSSGSSKALHFRNAALYEGMRTGLMNAGFQDAILALTPPEKGLFCSISITRTDSRPTSNRIYGYLSRATWGVFPYYGETASYAIHYELYIDGRSRYEHEYKITEKYLVWVAAIFVRPFLSDGWDYFPLGEPNFYNVIGSTARYFRADARRDGVL